jgi:hypothetical protein
VVIILCNLVTMIAILTPTSIPPAYEVAAGPAFLGSPHPGSSMDVQLLLL